MNDMTEFAFMGSVRLGVRVTGSDDHQQAARAAALGWSNQKRHHWRGEAPASVTGELKKRTPKGPGSPAPRVLPAPLHPLFRGVKAKVACQQRGSQTSEPDTCRPHNEYINDAEPLLAHRHDRRTASRHTRTTQQEGIRESTW